MWMRVWELCNEKETIGFFEICGAQCECISSFHRFNLEYFRAHCSNSLPYVNRRLVLLFSHRMFTIEHEFESSLSCGALNFCCLLTCMCCLLRFFFTLVAVVAQLLLFSVFAFFFLTNWLGFGLNAALFLESVC